MSRRRHSADKANKTQRILKRLLLVVCSLLFITLVAFGIYLYGVLKNFSTDIELEEPDVAIAQDLEEPEPTADPSIPTVNPEELTTEGPDLEPKTNEDYGIINIAVFGVDNRYKKSFSGRTDVNIILTLDTKNNEVRMTSIMRDTLIYLPEKQEFNRINAAIVYEDGPEGAVNAIEKEFNIDIDHFIITSFRGMATIIDAMGGVTVYLSQDEVWAANGLIQEMNELYGKSKNKGLLEKPGDQLLGGIQAVAYMRTRKIGGVFERVERQKKVLAAARDKLANVSLADLDNLMKTVPKWVKTDMEPLELIGMAKDLYNLRGGGFRTTRAPFDGHYETARYNKMAILQYDKDITIQWLHDFIYEGKDPQAQ